MSLFSLERWAKQEPQSYTPLCGSCGIHKTCKSPFMKPGGLGRSRVLIVAEAPGATEDQQGTQLVGNAGGELSRLLSMVGVDLRSDCWLTNALICRPTERGRNRPPTEEELGYCRPNLLKTIQELKPEVIIPLGKPAISSVVALAWQAGKVEAAKTWAGWQIPSQKLNAWICPNYHPAYLLYEKDPILEAFTVRHLAAAFALEGRPWNVVPDYSKWCHVIFDPTDAARIIEDCCDYETPMAFDYETTSLKPDAEKSRILCCSISDGRTSFAFPWAGEVPAAMRKFLRSSTPKIAANAKFEDRWTRVHLNTGVRNWHWDTVLGAHWADCRKGICSLKFQAFTLLGVPDYNSHLQPYMEGEGGNGQNRLAEVEPRVLMKYCGLDSLLEVLVAREQMKGLPDERVG